MLLWIDAKFGWIYRLTPDILLYAQPSICLQELIFALKTQEQSLKDAARRKRRTHLKEVEELQGRLHEQRKKHKRVMERMLEQWNRDVAGLKQDAIELEKKYRSNVVVLPSESEPRFRKEAQKPDLLRFEQTLRCLEMSGI